MMMVLLMWSSLSKASCSTIQRTELVNVSDNGDEYRQEKSDSLGFMIFVVIDQDF